MLTRRSALAAGAAVSLGGAGRAAPRRIVSLNPCLDVILVHVADRSQIAALSHYSHEPASSSLGALGATFPFTYETAEEVLALRPDLVLSARHSSPATREALRRLGVRAELFDVPETVAASLKQVRQVARAIHRPARGEALVAHIEAALAAAAPPPGTPRLSALIYQAGGFASAQGTLMDEMMRRAGFENAASRYGLKRTGNVPLEHLVADPPDVLLAGEVKSGAPTWADRVLTHPALSRVAHRMHRASFPQQLTFCGGPVLIQTAAMLAKARVAALEARARGGRA
ncbi:ABC transporter substrate-binding protein [Phenylobacterium sp.]|uniref:ABC transporter substrate-binding protein n=1 Tax=Phenylobacterium sp. TaxID=1871053 RepID=UPI00286D3BE4|nr:ABC transporter substrate-binding protein [Phenylobacterium sp.]